MSRSLRPPLLAAFGVMLAFAVLQPIPRARASCDQPTLFTSTFRPLGIRAFRIALADVNRDGILDAVVATPDNPNGSFASSIAVLLGTGSEGVGDGGFGAQVSWPAGQRPMGVVVGDFDGDGIPDVVAANWSSANVSFLHGNGDGTFAAPVNYAAGPGPDGIVAADFNHDGLLDVAVANNKVAAISVLLGTGGGTFAAPVSYPVGDLSLGITTGDVNGDGRADLIATAYNTLRSYVYLGVGDGTFTSAGAYGSGGQPYDLTLADVSGDGKLDLLVGHDGYGGVAVLKGNGLGGFGAASVYLSGKSIAGIVVGDVDGDGLGDLVTTDTWGNNVIVLKGAGNGSFTLHSTYPLSSANPFGIAGGDLNGDGTLDVVTADYAGAGISILLGTCSGAPPSTSAPHLVSVLDVPNDQGGRVFLRWNRSPLDVAGGTTITGYRVWRRLPAVMAASGLRAGAAPDAAIRRMVRPVAGATTVEYWEAIATLPAEQLAGYGYTAATTQDSMAGSNPYTAFFVTALTANPTVFYESNVDSGYSVDNLTPPEPAPFAVVYGSSSNVLHWGSSPAADLLEFRLHRGATADFVPGPGNLVLATRDTGGVDGPGGWAYKLIAVDVHGNASRVALVSPAAPSAALAAPISVDAAPERIRLAWSTGGNPGLPAQVERRTGASAWTVVATLTSDATATLRYVDDAVTSGTRYGYRLAIEDGGARTVAGEVWATAEAPQFALEGVRPNPVTGRTLHVEFVLPGPAPARLELFDVTGRRLAVREVGSLGAGRHVVDLAPPGRLPAGMYLIRFGQGAAVRTARAVVLD